MPDLPEGEEGIRAILQMREEGALFAQLEERRYVLILHELYGNGTTSNGLIEDPAVAADVGKRTGLGPPTDPNGWGVWEVPTTTKEG